MSTSTNTAQDIVPSPMPVEMKVHERVASDLLDLAELASSNPAIGELLAWTVEMLYIVLRRDDPIGQDDIVAAAIESAGAGATRTPPDRTEPMFATVGVQFPAGAIRLMVTQLNPSGAEPHVVVEVVS